MAVKLRLMRMGKKKQPTYRIVAADARSPRNGRFIEIVGAYDPRPDPSVVTVDNERALHWLRHGAQPTDRVRKLLRISGAWEAFESGAAAPPPSTTPIPAAAPPAVSAAPPEPSAASEAPVAKAGSSAESESPAAESGSFAESESAASEAPAAESGSSAESESDKAVGS